MINFIERIKSYSKRKDAADMAIRAWKSANEEVYADFCKRIDAVAKGNMSVLIDMYQMMRDCTPPEALIMYNWLSDFVNGKVYQVSKINSGLANIPRPSPDVSPTSVCG